MFLEGNLPKINDNLSENFFFVSIFTFEKHLNTKKLSYKNRFCLVSIPNKCHLHLQECWKQEKLFFVQHKQQSHLIAFC